MQIAQEIGGYTLGGADLLRRAMGKKKPEEMAKHRDDLRRRRDEERRDGRPSATQLFDLMEKFAGYGFNKSHAAAYALIAYQTAYFKAHHPSAFMAANLSLVMDDTDKVRHFRDDAIALGPHRCCRPTSTRRTTASSRWTRSRSATAWAASRAPAQAAIEAIVAARARGRPVPRPLRLLPAHRQARRSTGAPIEALVRAGAFDAIEPRRAALLASVGIALDAAERARGERRAGVAVRRGIGGARRWRSSRRATGPTPSGCRTRRPRSATTCRGIRSHGYAAELAPLMRTTLANLAPAPGARAGRGHRHADARAGEPPRQDGVRHARRRPRLGGDHGLQRDLRRRAQPAARGPARDRRSQGHAAHDRRRRVAGPAHHRRERLRPRRRSAGSAPRA